MFYGVVEIEQTNARELERTLPLPQLTLLSDEVLDEPLLVVALRDDVDQDIVLLPEAVDLVVLIFDDGALPVPCDALLDVLLLRDVVFVRVCECRPKIC